MDTVAFPGLGIEEFALNPVVFQIGSWPIYWYGLIIAVGFLLAVLYCSYKARSFGIDPEELTDMLIYNVPLSIIGARLYYVIFYLDLYRNSDGSYNFVKMIRIWDGGLAIYGAVIVAAITLLVFCYFKKLPFFAFADLGVFGLLIGQLVGRWGNFVNVEAYGGETTLPWRMGIYEAGQYIEVHPTFLYESLWNLVGLILLIVIAKNWRKFDGQMMALYFLWYGFGRGLIEGLRTDSLYFFQTGLRVSQVFGFATAAVALIFLLYFSLAKKHTPEQLWVNRRAAMVAAEAEVEVETETEAESTEESQD